MAKILLQRDLQEFQTLGAFHTAQEIAQQPRLWCQVLEQLTREEKQLRDFLKRHCKANTKVIFTGAGTSEFVGNTVTPYLKSLGKENIFSIATTDLVLAPEAYLGQSDEVLLISCARSGNSPESVAAAKIVEQVVGRCAHMVVTCNPEGALASSYAGHPASYIFAIADANDKGFAMTGSFTCMVLVCALLLQLDELPTWEKFIYQWAGQVDEWIQVGGAAVCQLAAQQKKRVVCLGSAQNKGIAQEAHLKVLELSSSQNTANFDTPLGFRHGPKSVLSDQSIIFFFSSEVPYTKQYELDMLAELMETKGKHLVVVISAAELPGEYCHVQIPIPLLPAAAPQSASILYSLAHIIVAQLYALENSICLGVQPDTPSPSGSVNRVVQGVHIYPYQLCKAE